MRMPEPAQAQTVQNLYQEIGLLSTSNKFLSGEIERLQKWIEARGKEIDAEVAQIEKEVEVEEAAVASKIKAVIARVRVKL